MEERSILNQLSDQERAFREWLSAHYSSTEIEQELYDESGFEAWNTIESLFEELFAKVDFKTLSEDQLETITYLIGRQWDMGNIFAYWQKGFGLLGMTEDQFLTLAQYGLSSKDWSFQQQCAASLHKVVKNKSQAINIALCYYQHSDADIRRHALHSLFKMNSSEVLKLAEDSWQSDGPLERESCLLIWERLDNELYVKRRSEIKNVESP